MMPPLTIVGAGGQHRFLTPFLFPGAGNPPARFDERGVETEPQATALHPDSTLFQSVPDPFLTPFPLPAAQR